MEALLACLHVANVESKGQGHGALTRYVRNVLVYNHILYITGKKKQQQKNTSLILAGCVKF